MGRKGTSRGILTGATIAVPQLPDRRARIKMTYKIDEGVLAKIKRLRIQPSAVIQRELRREIRRREKRKREAARSQIINKFSGQVLTTE